MSDAKKGIAGAHTRGDGGDAAALGDGGVVLGDVAAGGAAAEAIADGAAAVTGAVGVDAAAADLARLLAADAAPGDQGELLDDLPDQMPEATRNRLAAKRGRGRPPGAANRRSERMRDYLLRQGFTHPMVGLAATASARPEELAAELGCDRLEAAELIRRCQADLLPYFESKAPVQVTVDREERHLFVVGHIDMTPPADSGGTINLFGGNDEDYQSVEGDPAIRRGDHPSDGSGN